MTKPIIEIENISKCYRLGASREPYLSLRDEMAKTVRRILPAGRNRSASLGTDFWALNDVTFKVNEGEAVGVIGRNGAGKSTLLKILSQITPPTRGRITMRGRVASLLEVGTGFHPELTGRENIFLNGAILGMTRHEIKRKFDEIVAFSEVEKFLETPVKRYSSGMYVRLAFAVAAHLDPEILIIDEVLAVGDADFQKKCLGKMGDVVKSGRTVLFVSHNMSAVTALCSRVVRLRAGTLDGDGPVDKEVAAYLGFGSRGNAHDCLTPERKAEGSGEMKFLDIYSSDENGRRTSNIFCGGRMQICIEFESLCSHGMSHFALDIQNYYGHRVAYCNSFYTTGHNLQNLPRRGMLKCCFPRLPLMPGEYRIDAAIHCNGQRADYLCPALFITVHEGNFYGSGKIPTAGNPALILLDHSWEMDNTISDDIK